MLAMSVVRTSREVGRILAWAGIAALILGNVLLDAAFAFRVHGTAIQRANAGMFVCVGIDFVVAMLLFRGLLRFRDLRKPISQFR
jgi:hypothetical protein